LRFCTKDCKCGNRIDIALQRYVGKKVKMCTGCRTAYYISKLTLDHFIKKSGVSKQIVLENLAKPYWRKGLVSTLRGIALWGAQKPFTGSSPFLVVWNITRLCNLNCVHCYEDAHTPRPDELTPAQRLEVIDKLADAYVAYVAISGGEPLMLPDIWDVAARLNSREIAWSVATNGTLLTPENCAKLAAHKCLFVQVSLDGATPESHNKWRGAAAFEQTVKGIKNAVAAGLCVGISTTVSKHNLHEVPKIIDLAEKLGCKIFLHYNFIPTGRGKEIARLDISPQEREALLNMLAERNKTSPVTLLSTAPQYSRVCVAHDQLMMTHFQPLEDKTDKTSQLDPNSVAFLAEFVGGCGAGRLYCGLEPNGDIEPCVFIPIKLGNILTDDLREIWQNNETLQRMRSRHEFKGNCQKCVHRNICGGCRARAYAYHKDVAASDPGCVINSAEWEKLTKAKRGLEND
jgi:radical SAM protein with 4Fe4S-binding SPASM domain